MVDAVDTLLWKCCKNLPGICMTGQVIQEQISYTALAHIGRALL